jgi:hypothetical protein
MTVPRRYIQALYLETEGDLRHVPATIHFGPTERSLRPADAHLPIPWLQWRLALLIVDFENKAVANKDWTAGCSTGVSCIRRRNAKHTWTTCAAQVDRCSPPSRGTLSPFLVAAKQSFAPLPLAGRFAFNGAQGSMCGFCSGSPAYASCDRSSLNP